MYLFSGPKTVQDFVIVYICSFTFFIWRDTEFGMEIYDIMQYIETLQDCKDFFV